MNFLESNVTHLLLWSVKEKLRHQKPMRYQLEPGVRETWCTGWSEGMEHSAVERRQEMTSINWL